MEPIQRERVLAAYQAAPQPVRDAFNSDVTTGVIADLRTKYRMHVDVAGNLGREVGYLLLGLRSPAEFFGSLMLSGTDEQTARGIMQEVNERIFMPLKQQMTGKNPAAQPIASYAPPEAPAPSAASPAVPPPSIEYRPVQTLPGSSIAAPMQPAAKEVETTPPAEPAQTPVQPSEPVPARESLVPLTKEYAADPYREPVS